MAEMHNHDWRPYWLQFSEGQTPSTTLMDPEFLDTIRATDDVLDLGCGYGRNATLLAERAQTVTGVDINAREVAFAALHNAAKNIRYEVMDATELTFPPRTFDKAVLSGVLGGVSLGIRHQILPQVRSVLRPGGSIYVSEYALKHDTDYSKKVYQHGQDITGEYGAVAVYDTVGPGGDTIKFIGKHFDPQELADLLEDHGFTEPTIRTSTLTHTHALDPNSAPYVSNMVSIWAKNNAS